MMFKVVLQKPVPGKSEPKEKDLLNHRRVLIVEARNEHFAAGYAEAYANDHGCVELVSVEKVDGQIVVLHP